MSEVARLKRQIDEEIAVMQQALTGFAAVAKHETITHHYEMLSICFERLSVQIGEQAAIQTIMDELERCL